MCVVFRKSAFLATALLFVLSAPLLADIRGTDINGNPVILRSDGTWSYISSPPDKTSACRRYTDNALAQQRANLKYKCGFAGPRWHQDYNRHFNWCMGVNINVRGAATIARRDALNQCIRGLKTSACRRYTDNALAQQRANLKYKCGFAGPRWHQDYNRHYNWCMGVNVNVRGAATIARRDALNQCTRGLKSSACRNYANTAITQQKNNLRRRCNYTGIRWHQDYNKHYNWCMATNAAAHASETAIRRNALARCRPKPPPPGGPELSCRRSENVEKGCCCFKGAHTYAFSARRVGVADVTFDTGKGVNCRSPVRIEVRQAGKWRLIQKVAAVSSRGSNETAPTTVSIGVHGVIDAIRVGDGCVCCIDDSRIRLR